MWAGFNDYFHGSVQSSLSDLFNSGSGLRAGFGSPCLQSTLCPWERNHGQKFPVFVFPPCPESINLHVDFPSTLLKSVRVPKMESQELAPGARSHGTGMAEPASVVSPHRKPRSASREGKWVSPLNSAVTNPRASVTLFPPCGFVPGQAWGLPVWGRARQMSLCPQCNYAGCCLEYQVLLIFLI